MQMAARQSARWFFRRRRHGHRVWGLRPERRRWNRWRERIQQPSVF